MQGEEKKGPVHPAHGALLCGPDMMVATQASRCGSEKGSHVQGGAPFSRLCDDGGMFALAAVITFAVAFILRLMGESTGHVDLLILGLLFVALHLLWAVSLPWNRP